jgi:hypothetical protein
MASTFSDDDDEERRESIKFIPSKKSQAKSELEHFKSGTDTANYQRTNRIKEAVSPKLLHQMMTPDDDVSSVGTKRYPLSSQSQN